VKRAGHVRRLDDAQSSALEKETVLLRFGWKKKARAVGPRGAQERDELAGTICVAGGSSTVEAASGGAAVAVEMEKKRNTPVTVISLYRATRTTSKRRVARREPTEAHAGDPGAREKLLDAAR
jgi:hypothetical protein